MTLTRSVTNAGVVRSIPLAIAWVAGLVLAALPASADMVVGAGAVTIRNGVTVVVTGNVDVASNGMLAAGNSQVALTGNWSVHADRFTAGTSTVTFQGVTSSTLDAGASPFYNLVINKTAPGGADDDVTVTNHNLGVNGLATVTDGELVQGTTHVLMTGGLNVAAAGAYTNAGTGHLTLGADVSNAGVMTLNGNGGALTGGDADDIQIRSTVAGTQRNWQGTGTFIAVDVDVQDQTAIGGAPPFIDTISGTDSGNNINWFVGVLANVTVTPQALTAGANGDVTLTFQNANFIPLDGSVTITFPDGFTFPGAMSISSQSGIDGTFTVAQSGQTVTITRNNDGAAVPNGAAVSLTLTNITNPAVSGTTEVFTVTTTRSDSSVIDAGQAPALPIAPAAFTAGPSFAPQSLLAGATTNAQLTFTTTTALSPDGRIIIDFPEGFDLTAVTGVTVTNPAGFVVSAGAGGVSVSDRRLTILGNGAGAVAPGGTAFDLTINGIRNPSQAGVTSGFSVATADNAGSLQDAGTAPGVALTAAGTLNDLAVTPQNLITGATNVTATVSFTPANALPADGGIRITFPDGFDLSNVAGPLANVSGMNGAFAVSVSGQTVTITRQGDGAAVAAGASVSFQLSGITNPSSAGLTGTFHAATAQSDGATIDSGEAPGVPMAAGSLSDVSITPASAVAGAMTDHTVQLTTSTAVPANGRIKVEYPAGFNLTTVTGATSATLGPGLTTVVIGQVLCVIVPNGIPAGTAVADLVISNVTNTSTTGATPAIPIYTAGIDNTPIESGTAEGFGITAATGAGGTTLSNVTVTPNTLLVGAIAERVTMGFTTSGVLPADGRIQLVFPEGFDVSGITGVSSAADLDGTLSVSVSGQTATIARSGGSPLPAGATVDDLVLAHVRNPVHVGATGSFAVSTLDGAGTVLETGTALGVTITGHDGLILLTLTADRGTVRIGEAVTFTAELKNLTDEALTSFHVDVKLGRGLTTSHVVTPPGFSSSPIDGAQVSFRNYQELPARASVRFPLTAIVGSQAGNGAILTTGFVHINPVISNTALVTLQIVPDPVFQVSTLIGKVFWDKDGDGIQQPGESGLPDVRVITEEGALITTDAYGRYHVPDVTPGRHQVKIDQRSLPDGATLTTDAARVIHATDAMLQKANFGVRLPDDSALAAQVQGLDRPIRVTVRQQGGPPLPRLSLDFNLFSATPQRYLYPNAPDATWIIPLNPRTNFPLFVERWTIEVFEAADDAALLPVRPLNGPLHPKETATRKKIAEQSGAGSPPRLVELGVEARHLRNRKKPLELVFTVFDKQGKTARLTYGLAAKNMKDTLSLILVDQGAFEHELSLRGTGVMIEGESPLTSRIEIFDTPVAVLPDGTFRADVILPDGAREIPITVFEHGLDPKTGQVLEVTPMVMTRSIHLSDDYVLYDGFGELELGHSGSAGNRDALSAQDVNRLEHTVYSDHRLAYYVKGKLGGKYHLTASLDTQRKRKEAFRKLEPEDFYATYGDEAHIDYDATDTQDEVFAHLEFDKTYFRYGNFNTGFTGTEFADYQRSLHGFKVHRESLKTGFDGKGKHVAAAFLANGRQAPARNEFAVTGGSLYYLKHRDVIAGTEKVEVEVRDRLTGLPIRQVPLVYGREYDVDYDQGRIRLLQPVFLYDLRASDNPLSTEIFQTDPQYLVVDYEFDPGFSMKDASSGVRYTKEWLPGVRLGGTLVQQEQGPENYHLRGLDAQMRLFNKIDLTGEIANSGIASARSFTSHDGGLTFVEATTSQAGTGGTAYKIESATELWRGMLLNGYFRALDRDFSSTGTLSQAGTQKYGILARQAIGAWGRLSFLHEHETLLEQGNLITEGLGARRANANVLLAEATRGRLYANASYRRSALAGAYQPPSTAIQPPQAREDLLGAGLRYDFTPKWQGRLEAQTELSGQPNKQLRTSLIRKLRQNDSVFVTHAVGSRGHGLLTGIDSSLIKGQKAFGNPGAFEQPSGQLEQDVTLGYTRAVGAGVTAGVAQSASGDRTLTVSRTLNNGNSYSVAHQRSKGGQMVMASQETRLSPVLTSYANVSTERQKSVQGMRLAMVNGVKYRSLNARREGYVEDERATYQASRVWVNRMGLGYLLTPELRVDGSYERGHRHDAQAGVSASTFQIVKARAEYNKFDRLKWSQDVEVRREDQTKELLQPLLHGAGELKISPDWTLLGRYEWGQTEDTRDPDAKPTLGAFGEYQLGLAYRPVEWDWLNVLTEFKRIVNKSPGSQTGLTALSGDRSRILRGEAALDLGRQLTFVEKAAVRMHEAFGTDRSRVFLWGHRLNWHVHEYVDLIGEYRTLSQTLSDDKRHGVLAEASVKPLPGLQVSAGYNFMKYDAAATSGLDVEGRGFYTRVMYDPIEAAEALGKRRDREGRPLGSRVAGWLKGIAQPWSRFFKALWRPVSCLLE